MPDDRLGMHEPIARRDFLNGTLLASAGLVLGRPFQAPATRSPAEAWNGYGGVGDYARAHGKMYDVVAVGGGISGLAAAVFFQKKRGGGGRGGRCLVLDNHAIFGGEAKRNEFRVDGQTVVAHQGSAIFLVPQKGGDTDAFYNLIGMDRSAFAYPSWRGPEAEMPLSHSPYAEPQNYGFYFGPQFGARPGVWVIDPWGRNLDGAPLSDAVKAELLRWRNGDDAGPRLPRPVEEGDAISRQLDRITLEEHLMARHQISRETVRTFLSPVEGGGYGLGPDVLSAFCDYAIETQFPGDGDEALGDQMFPDGNSGFARLMVKTLISDAFAGPRTVDAVWQNRVRFGALDRSGN